MKYTYSREKIHVFGGINFADRILGDASVYRHIDRELGPRGPLATYRYSDLFRSYLHLALCGGDCAEDIGEHLGGELAQMEGFEPPSPDTLLRLQKELATEKELAVSKGGALNELCNNRRMNRLLVGLLVHTGQLVPGAKGLVLDFDNQFVPAGKYDSRKGYKKENGYFPGIASIDNHPVYVEGRNGNSNVKFGQAETLERTYALLREHGIRVAHSRMDCGSFTEEVVGTVEANSDHFYIRAQRCAALYEAVRGITDWGEAEIGGKSYGVASIRHAPFGGEREYRYVISRETRDDRQGDLFTGDSFTYRAIITDNHEMGDAEVVRFYNARGNSERLFDEMNNDFLWKRMPFSFLNQNTVFLIMTAICRNLYHHILSTVAEKLDFVRTTFRLKKFIFRFVALPVKWIRRGRQRILKLYTDRPYHLLLE